MIDFISPFFHDGNITRILCLNTGGYNFWFIFIILLFVVEISAFVNYV